MQPDGHDMVGTLQKLWRHAVWADALLWDALRSVQNPDAWREYAHILGADEGWLSRLEGRAPVAPIWPASDADSITLLRERVVSGYAHYVGGLTRAELTRVVAYRNSTGQSFENSVLDILLQVVMHAQYHRGKVNRALAEGEHRPAPVDYIGFVRGVAAARTPR